MKAVIWKKYGDPDLLELGEMEKPSPAEGEVLVKIHASSVTAGDARLRGLRVPPGFWLLVRLMYGFSRPRIRIPGMNISGEIEAAGENVEQFKPGDLVYGSTGMKLGAHAEYACVSQNAALVKKPGNASHQQAVAAIFGGMTALHFLRDKAQVQKGQKVLINGASGAVGTAAIQLAKYFGADVTGISSAATSELIKSLGAGIAIDYSKEDFTRNGQQYDVILDAVGNLSWRKCKKSLMPQGKLLLLNTGLLGNLASIVIKNLICGVAQESKEALDFLRERIENGEFKPVIDKTFPLEQIAEAHRHVDKGHKKGNTVLSVIHSGG